jgi:ABC-type oligopeptide transport system substrate-binding subunit
MKRFLCLLSIFALIACAVGAEAEVKNPDIFVLADYRTVQTIDPATSYDVAGSMRIWNLYETLIFFDGS